MSAVYVCLDEPAPSDPAACVAYEAVPYTPDPFQLTLADAQALVVPILALWALAWVFRQSARIINSL